MAAEIEAFFDDCLAEPFFEHGFALALEFAFGVFLFDTFFALFFGFFFEIRKVTAVVVFHFGQVVRMNKDALGDSVFFGDLEIRCPLLDFVVV